MPASLDPQPRERPSTYFVLDRPNDEELTRLTTQDHSITSLMGGVLPEQPDPSTFRRVLDIGCGSGGWIIEAAKVYPAMSLVGIDISRQMVNYASEQAEVQHVADRVKFQVMDALQLLDFPIASFDLVNLRFGCSFLRTWEWHKLVGEILRVLRPRGVVRLTDAETFILSNSPALTRFGTLLQHALFQSGHLFEHEQSGPTAHQLMLLERYRCQQVQTKLYVLEYRAGTAEWQAFYDNAKYAFRTFRPFLQRWGCAPKDYDTIYQQALDEMRRPDFHATWHFITAWGTQPDKTTTIRS